jgi:tetratricopeptide (TPR) repeat protein
MESEVIQSSESQSQKKDKTSEIFCCFSDIPFQFSGNQIDGTQAYINYIFLSVICNFLTMNWKNDSSKQHFKVFSTVYITIYFPLEKEKKLNETLLNDFLVNLDFNQSNYFTYWYTKQSFIFKMINQCFRENNFLHLFYIRFYISNLSKELRENKSKNQPKYLYRGTGVSAEEFAKWQNNNIPIILKGFISTTSSLKQAQKFISKRQGLIPVLFIIKTEGHSDKFVSVEDYSTYPQEKEHLININSLIKINRIWYNGELDAYLIKCYFCHIEELRMNITKITLNYEEMIHKILLKDYTYQEFYMADIFYHMRILPYSLNLLLTCKKYINVSDVRNFSLLMDFLGKVYTKKGELKMALRCYKMCFNTMNESLGKDNPNLCPIYNGIGLVYSKKGNNKKAIQFYEIALTLQKTFEEKDTGPIYSNLSLSHAKEGEYEKALIFAELAIRFYEKSLADNHHNLAVTYSNIASIYSFMKEYDKSILCYKKSLSIYTNTLGTAHAYTLITYSCLARVYKLQKDNREATDTAN